MKDPITVTLGDLPLSNRAKHALENLRGHHPRGMVFDKKDNAAELFFDVLTCDQLTKLGGVGSHTLNEVRRVLRDAGLKMKCGCPSPHADAPYAAHPSPEGALDAAAHNLKVASRRLAAAVKAAKEADDAVARARATYDAALQDVKVAAADLGAGG